MNSPTGHSFTSLLQEAYIGNKRLLDSFKFGNVIRNGVRVAIVGKPNAGKSTLLNNLLNENRAIVSDIAGTTRDTIEEVLNIDGILFRLMDTAGIREHTTDIIEQAGMDKTFEKIKGADLVVYVFDVNETGVNELKGLATLYKVDPNKLLLAGNKTDLLKTEGELEKFDKLENKLFISAKNDPHLDNLKRSMFNKAAQRLSPDDTIVTNIRHYESLRMVDAALKDILIGLDAGVATDLLALDVRRCLHYLGEITGEITNDDQLDYIFSKFCIGK